MTDLPIEASDGESRRIYRMLYDHQGSTKQWGREFDSIEQIDFAWPLAKSSLIPECAESLRVEARELSPWANWNGGWVPKWPDGLAKPGELLRNVGILGHPGAGATELTNGALHDADYGDALEAVGAVQALENLPAWVDALLRLALASEAPLDFEGAQVPKVVQRRIIQLEDERVAAPVPYVVTASEPIGMPGLATQPVLDEDSPLVLELDQAADREPEEHRLDTALAEAGYHVHLFEPIYADPHYPNRMTGTRCVCGLRAQALDPEHQHRYRPVSQRGVDGDRNPRTICACGMPPPSQRTAEQRSTLVASPETHAALHRKDRP